MIGGVDKYFRTKAPKRALDAGVRAIMNYWPDAAFENGVTGERYGGYWQIAFGSATEIFVYQDSQTADRWDELGAVPELMNSMIYLSASPDAITAVVGDPTKDNMPAILSALGESVKQDLFKVAMSGSAA